MRYQRAISITQRHIRLLRLIRKGTFSAQALATKLGVSEQTIYRDIQSLRHRGHEIESRRSPEHWAYLLSANPLEKEA